MKRKIWIILVWICIFLAACDGPIRATPAPGPDQTWIDAPLDGSTLPLAPYTVVFHGASFIGVTEFEVQINGSVIAAVPPISQGSGGAVYGTLFLGEYNWVPQSPGTYLITVRAKGNGVYAPPDQVQVTIKGGKDIDLPVEATQQPMALVEDCIYTSTNNLFCREGPGAFYDPIDNFTPGQSAPIVGQSTDGIFWYVIGPNYGVVCTVPKAPEFGQATGNCDNQPRFTPIPPPSPTPTKKPKATPCPAGVPCPP